LVVSSTKSCHMVQNQFTTLRIFHQTLVCDCFEEI
jgi:hypothetical protein